MITLPHEFRSLPATDGYVLEIRQLGTELRVERLRRERGELIGELIVASSLPGTRSASGILHAADFNLSSARARTERARIVAERANAQEVDWIGLLEELCQSVIAAERVGQPAILLRDAPRPPVEDALEIDVGLRLPRNHPAILFGDGGDGKSYLALYWATLLAGGGLRVLYADWEFSGEDHRARLERISGPDMPDVWYVRCERPLTVEMDRLRRIVREEAIDYVIADSVAFACDGAPESAETAAAYFRAVRRIGVGSLHIAHITKGENGDQKPFGSAFWANGARSTWFAKRSSGSPDAGRISVGLFNRKNNLGQLAPAIGYEIEFGPDRTTFRRLNIADTDLADRVPIQQRMHSLLAREGAMTMAAIASELDVPVDTIVKTAKRHEGKRFTRVPGSDGIFRIGLLARSA